MSQLRPHLQGQRRSGGGSLEGTLGEGVCDKHVGRWSGRGPLRRSWYGGWLSLSPKRWLSAQPLGEDGPAGRPAPDRGRDGGAGLPPLAYIPICFEKFIVLF